MAILILLFLELNALLDMEGNTMKHAVSKQQLKLQEKCGIVDRDACHDSRILFPPAK